MSQTSTSETAAPLARPNDEAQRPGVEIDRGLSSAEFERFASLGYLSLSNFSVDPELTLIHETLETLFREKIGHREGRQFDMLGPDNDINAMTQPQILNPSQFVPMLLRTAHFRRITTIARQLLGPHAQFSFDHGILKPAGSSAATPWHQDEAHHENGLFRYRQISFWMALQNTPRESGCMRYIPYSHRGAVLPHQTLNHDPRVHAMECEPGTFEEAAAVIEPATAGTCILHDGRTLHSALPNTSQRDRMAYIVAFIGPPLLNPNAKSKSTTRTNLNPPKTANRERRQRWLLRGGALTALARRVRLGLRSEPSVLWLKMRLAVKALFTKRRPHSR